MIRKLDSSGNLTTIAGNGIRGYADGTGGPTGTAEFSNDYGVAVDGSGNVYVADGLNCAVRKIDSSGNVTTVAGNPSRCGYADGTGGPTGTAELNLPSDLALDGAGNLYVTDYDNCAIRVIDPSGNVTTLAGNANRCGWADGTGGPTGTAELAGPYGVTVDSSGNVYFTEVPNHVVREIDSGGNVTTIAGHPGSLGYVDGTGGLTGTARFGDPGSLKLDAAGNLVLVDEIYNVVRLINSAASVSTIAGDSAPGHIDGPADTAQFWDPRGLAMDLLGNIYVGDSSNNDVRMLSR